MDGDGSIQVNHWRKKYLQYRLIIKLSNLKSNEKMLKLIQKRFKGHVRTTTNGEFVLWALDDKIDIINAIKVFDKYPPLTSRLTCCLSFLKTCLSHNDVETYLATRDNKYSHQSKIIQDNMNKFDLSNLGYFNSWLSGFIESEGCFSIRKDEKNKSFSIGQNNDIYIINLIKSYFGASNTIRLITPLPSAKNKNQDKKFYSIEIYKNTTLLKIINHCETYPLLGAKKDNFLKFKKSFK